MPMPATTSPWHCAREHGLNLPMLDRADLQLQPGFLSRWQLHAVHAAGGVTLELARIGAAVIRASAAVVQQRADGDAPVYGVNTGFGKLANQRISKDAARHAAAQPDPIPQRGRGRTFWRRPVVRLMLAHQGRQPGARPFRRAPVVVDTLLAAFNAGWCPMCPAQGSVGASGDLAPLSHMTWR
jgi:histidine ammonia-lyase